MLYKCHLKGFYLSGSTRIQAIHHVFDVPDVGVLIALWYRDDILAVSIIVTFIGSRRVITLIGL